MSKYLELIEGVFTQEHLDKQKNQNPYVAYSIQDDRVIYTIVPKETPINYFYIESLEDNNIITLDSTTWAGYGNNKSKLEYSNDATSWNSMNGIDSITINNGECLYMRCIEGNICKDIYSIPEEEANTVLFASLFKASTNCNIGGNINTVMFDYTYKTEECVLPMGAFAGLFAGIDITSGESISYIIDASKLELPATALADGCYNGMFIYCKSLVTAPELPATTLAEGCYGSMFQFCSSLATAPELPAIKLARSCYQGMFHNCKSLATAPELPATTLAEGCYSDMFHTCKSLIAAPELPATELANSCYHSMFAYCKSLVTAPELPATELANSCYHSMFKGCTSLTTTPELPATILVERCYTNMFEGCTSLNTAPELPATGLVYRCYFNMFRDCTSLSAAPKLPATELAKGCYDQMFYNCTSLTTAPELPAIVLTDECYYQMFFNCANLNRIKCLAVDISAIDCTSDWVSGVASTGTFIKHPDMTDWTTGVDGIPEGWEVKDAVL